jgi:hypothetical protein
MSMNSMANAAIARRPDMIPIGEVPRTLDQIAKAAITPPSTTATPIEPGKPAAAAPTPVDTTVNVLFGYIPTEVLTLYVAVRAAIQEAGIVTSSDWLAFWIFLFATPVIQWLLVGTKLKTLQKRLPLKFSAWPVWEMFAATAAFMAWAFALPDSPFTQYDWYSSALSSLAVLVASTLLGLLAPLFQRPLST